MSGTLTGSAPHREAAGGTFLSRATDFQLALALTLLCAATRFLAFPASFWEWDDILFARSLHLFDLPSHSPHPPGFPVFVFLGRGLNVLFHNDHTSLALVSLLFASTLGAGIFYLFRELFADRAIAVAGSILTMFAPNIWIHSGAARSDEPAFAMGVICAALVLRGRRSNVALLWGCVLFGLGMGIRVTLLPLIAPILTLVFVGKVWRREWAVVTIGVLLGIGAGLCWYVPVVVHTGWHQYQEVMHQHSAYWFATDTAFSPGENSNVARRIRRFFVEMWGGPLNATVAYVPAVAGLLGLAMKRHWRTLGLLALSFVPFMLFTTVLNTPMSAPLYSFGYVPFFTGLAAAGFILIPQTTFGEARASLAAYAGICAAGVVATFAGTWSYPTIKLLRKNVSPPVQAMRWIEAHLDPTHDVIYYSGYFTPHLKYYLPQFKLEQWDFDWFQIPQFNLIGEMAPQRRTFALAMTTGLGSGSTTFRWPKGAGSDRLRTLSLGRYFEAQIADVSARRDLVYLDGWYEEESSGSVKWRWMRRSAKAAFLPGADAMTLRLRGAISNPSEANRNPTVILKVNGLEIDRFTVADNRVDRTVLIRTDPEHLWSTLTIETDQSFTPKATGVSNDARELGMQCFELSCVPAPEATPRVLDSSKFIGDGFYGIENGAPRPWRWAQKRATVHLPPLESAAQLTLTMHVPEQSDGSRTPVEVEVGGKVIDTFQPPPAVFTKSYRIPGVMPDSPIDLVLSTKRAADVPTDARELAMQVFAVAWTPVAQKPQ